MPSWSATEIIGSGRRNSGPRSKNSRWASTTARITRVIVLFRCSMLSISQRALRTLLLRNSRVCLSPFFSLRNFRHMPLMYRFGAGSLVISISYVSASSS